VNEPNNVQDAIVKIIGTKTRRKVETRPIILYELKDKCIPPFF
jgi:hypothetical protein